MGTPEENKELVHYYFEELSDGNLDVIEEVCADDYTTESDFVRSEIDAIGREAVRAAQEEIRAAFPDISIESQELYAEGDAVIAIQTWCGTHRGRYRGVPASGNEITYELWGRFVVEDDQIVRASVQGDNFGLFTQLGLELSVEGYQTLIETAPDPIIIADTDTGRVIETNSAAESLIERPREEIIGNYQWDLHPTEEPYEDAFTDVIEEARESPVSIASLADGSDLELVRGDGSRVLIEANVQVVTLAERTTLVSIYRDVSERRRREQRTEVLNRILRHNLRNELSVIEVSAEVLKDELEGESVDRARKIQDRARELARLGEKARVADEITAAETTAASQVTVRSIVDEVVADISERYPDHQIETTAPDPITVLTDGAAVEIALREAIENAVEHGTGDDTGAAGEDNLGDRPSQVRVTATPAPAGNGAEIGIEDNGNGIPSHELAVVDEGTETPLTHGSGIGIWLIHWAMTAIRGDASFEVTETGTRVTLSIPSLDSRT